MKTREIFMPLGALYNKPLRACAAMCLKYACLTRGHIRFALACTQRVI